MDDFNRKNNDNISNRIIAVDPGTREVGVAVFDKRELVYYGVKSFHKRKPLSFLLGEINRVFTQLFEEYCPGVLVIEKTFYYNNKNVSNLISAADEIKAAAKQKNLKIVEYAPKTVRKNICKTGKATKEETANVVCSRFPELHRYRQLKGRGKQKYWLNMFDAVALGLTYIEFSEKEGS